ncbi:glutathione-regulated potassium-efflux system protein KefC [Janthinobacterium agaricidamnosum]|uniref:Glutathione-regulated potassium-efflux system protein kefC n=1 Tax=Janthinobacterium agaricidamnosum NBRC 102515 = DSM 9628 TaxID=1349767 RepID=W0VE63_9BURK|nr:glutathione-regulated potassium-efflux system protein KefC [Janthinobacterium agaricidamnosum]CDG85617.1 glutathione-regulated potassium-efflux system protein kefC [Janthinobacterium agaricidamnosum NBRC 102515 = DSM 9628]
MQHHSYLLNLLFYLVAAIVMVPLAKRLGMGAVLGYLVAGVVIGPWGLGLINNVEVILGFSEFGVVLLLFLIGLELEPKRLWLLRRPIFGWGGAQVALVSAGLCAVALVLGVDWRTALVGALGLSLSSTAIVLATLGERKLMPTPAGSAGFSILLFQDIAAIPMIALVPLLAGINAHSGEPAWWRALKLAGVLAALVICGRFLVNPILRFIAKTGLRDIFTAFALLLVIAICVLMESVGLSMALGTFIAGVLLADSEYRHELVSDLEPFKGLLLGLFFIAVGMSVDFGVLRAQPLLILGLVAGLLAVKIALLYGLSKFFDIPRGQQLFFALLLSQGGEFAFVVFAAAVAAHVFTPEIGAILVVAVTLSMVATPLLLLLHDKLVAPRLQALKKRRPDDRIEAQDNPIVIAGFGRFGQIIGRLLAANRIGVTVLDHDPDQIELLRKFGFKVFYGDATRVDLLVAAGIDKASALVIAIDNADDSLALVDAVRHRFPALTILARARNVTHYYELMKRGVTLIERETFEAALLLGQQTLLQAGFSAERAHRAAGIFRTHNLKTLLAVAPHFQDQQKVMSLTRQAREELEDMFEADAAAFAAAGQEQEQEQDNKPPRPAPENDTRQP